MELRVNNNNIAMPNLNQPPRTRNYISACFAPKKDQPKQEQPKRKRDFRFQVIQVCQGPKWFVWPSHRKDDDEDEDEEEEKATDQENNQTSVDPPAENNSQLLQPPNHLKLNDNNQTFTVPSDTNITNGALTPVTATNQTNVQSPMSEPTTRRIAFKAATKSEPISMSAPSTTFKILSVSKKWNDSLGESDDEDYLDTQMADETNQMTIGGSLPPQSSCRCNCGCFN